MSTPSSSTEPDNAALGISSCIRLRTRRNVDLPHPDGPISAVTLLGSMTRLIRSSTLFEPNQALTSVVRRPDRAWAAPWVAGGSGSTPSNGSPYDSSIVVIGAVASHRFDGNRSAPSQLGRSPFEPASDQRSGHQ